MQRYWGVTESLQRKITTQSTMKISLKEHRRIFHLELHTTQSDSSPCTKSTV